MSEDSGTMDKIERVAGWLSNGKRNSLMLYGSVGNGKTTMGKAVMTVLREFKSSENNAYYITASNLVRLKYDADFASTFAISSYNDYLSCDILLLDELGSESESVKNYGNTETPIHDLLIYRYEHNKPTIITSNLDDNGLLLKYGERIYDRISEQFDKIEYTEESYRKRK